MNSLVPGLMVAVLYRVVFALEIWMVLESVIILKKEYSPGKTAGII